MSENPSWWDDLAVAALLGTDRRPQLDAAALPGALGVAAARLSGDPATVLLDAAALAVAYRRGGVQPGQVPAEPDRAPAERSPKASPRAGALLAAALAGPAELVAYWCRTAAAAGLLAPDAHLPALLDRAAGPAALRAAIVPVLGERGRWLARQQPRWAAMIAAVELEGDEPAPGELEPGEPDESEVWRLGAPDERAAWLRRARRRDPVAALAALSASWPKEPEPERIRFLRLLAGQLGPADEAFLESVLDDSRPPVRAAAAELLAVLPGSAYTRRMRHRAGALVRSEPGRAGPVVVELPGRLDPRAARDGITDTAPAPATSRTRPQWWLEQIVAATPLDHWEARFGSAVQAVNAGFDEAAQPAIRSGWVRATLRQRNRDWALAVLGTGTRLGVAALLPLLDPGRRVAAVRARLPGLGSADVAALTEYLATCPGPWPPSLVDELLIWVLTELVPTRATGAAVRSLLELMAFRFPVAGGGRRVAEAARLIEDDLWRQRLGDVVRTISARTRIHEELQ